MNILYIGPYRDKSVNGLISINHIESLKNHCALTIKPLFLTSDRTQSLDNNLIELEKKQLLDKKYDACIQYAPIEHLIPFELVSLKNYCIPIVSYTYHINNEYQNYNILSHFDTIFYDSQYDTKLFKNILSEKKKYKLFNYSDVSVDPPLIDKLSIHSKRYKFYTFVHKETYRFINKILLAFLMLQKKLQTCLLIIAVDNEEHHKLVSDNINFLSKQLKINYIHNYIKILNLETKEIDVLSLHKSANCLIDVRDYTNNNFQTHLAKLYNNAIITNDNLSYSEDIELESINNNESYIRYDLNIMSLLDKMKNVINTMPIYNDDNIPTLDKLICK